MRIFLLFNILISAFISVHCFGLPMIGPGKWSVQNVLPCDDSDQYESVMEISRKKLNRTHDCFTINFHFVQEFNSTFAIDTEIYKEVDGGYKYYLHLADDSACNFINEYAEENFQMLLLSAGIDPPICRIPPGEYTANDFVFNYSEIKHECPYGSFQVISYLLLDGKRISCVQVFSKFEKHQDDDE